MRSAAVTAVAVPGLLKEFMIACCMTDTITNGFMTYHGLVTTNDIVMFHQEDAERLFRVYNKSQTRSDNKSVMSIKSKVEALLFWIHELSVRKIMID